MAILLSKHYSREAQGSLSWCKKARNASLNRWLSVSQSVQSLNRVLLFETPWTAARQASLSITNSRSPPKPMSIQLVMPFNRLIFCHPLLLLTSILPSIRVFSDESALRIRWPRYWSFSFNISPTNEHPGLISFLLTNLLRDICYHFYWLNINNWNC